MPSYDWWYDDEKQFGLAFTDEVQAATYDARQGTTAEDEATLLKSLGFTPGMRLADLGCGTGLLVCEAARMGGLALGVDIAQAMIDFARRRAASDGLVVEFQRAGFLNCELRETHFDLITTKAAFHQLPDFWKALALLRIHRALKPGGRLYLKDVVFDAPLDRLEAVAEGWVQHIAENTGYTRADGAAHVREEHSTFRWVLERLLNDAGFRIIHTTQTGVYATFLAERL
jgi:ubiquinone/menaquinone biosynthesis C-methylase UbiE